MSDVAQDFLVSTHLLFGWGASGRTASLVQDLGTRCFIVTTAGTTHRTNLLRGLMDELELVGCACSVFDRVTPNPTVSEMEEARTMALDFGADVILGVGGGSSLDTAKAVSLGVTHGGPLWDYRIGGSRSVNGSMLPVVTVNTTAGTGSQVSPVAVFTNEDTHSKMAIVDRKLCPAFGVIDPALTLSVPPRVTAATGFDVFAHAFESIIHVNHSPLVDRLAWDTLGLVAQYLPRAVAQGDDQAAREAMAIADTWAGICITNVGTVLPHGIAMAVGGQVSTVMHGEALAAVYPAVLRYSCSAVVEPLARLYEILEAALSLPLKDTLLSAVDKARRCPDLIELFLQRIGLPDRLSQLGLSEDLIDPIVRGTFQLPDYRNNPRVPTHSELMQLLEASFRV